MVKNAEIKGNTTCKQNDLLILHFTLFGLPYVYLFILFVFSVAFFPPPFFLTPSFFTFLLLHAAAYTLC